MQNSSEIQLVDWNAWEDEKAEPESPGKSAEELAAEELFKDMEPTINKAKIVRKLFFMLANFCDKLLNLAKVYVWKSEINYCGLEQRTKSLSLLFFLSKHFDKIHNLS